LYNQILNQPSYAPAAIQLQVKYALVNRIMAAQKGLKRGQSVLTPINWGSDI
jgi:hypothetical protein